MKILLIDVDSKMPNLALMKLSAWHKKQGDQVYLKKGLSLERPLLCQEPNKVYVSDIFSKEKATLIKATSGFTCPMEIGGYGISCRKLPDEIEHIMPDYSLYGIDYSMGYTSRGCIRYCPWCIIPRFEGQIKEHAPISEFLHPQHDKLILLDGNFLASPKASAKLHELAHTFVKRRARSTRRPLWRRLRVNFHQGLDIRLVTSENARALAEIEYRNWRFTSKLLHFAFDDPVIEKDVTRGIAHLCNAGIPARHQVFYMLCGFNTTFDQDYHRFEVLRNQHVLPFVMIYNNGRGNPVVRHFARWVNQRFYQLKNADGSQRIPWSKYDHGDSQEIIRQVIKPS